MKGNGHMGSFREGESAFQLHHPILNTPGYLHAVIIDPSFTRIKLWASVLA